MFKRRKSIPNPAADKLATSIVRKTIMIQQHWAMFMQRRAERLSLRAKKCCLVGLCIVTGVYCFYLITESLTGHITKNAVLVTRIHLPKYVIEENKPPPVSEKEYLQVERYKRYMDSCGLPIRPGLLDSIRQLEKIYQQSKK